MTMLLYISVCLRTRQDTISYSFIYIVQKAEFQGKAGEHRTRIRGKQENRGLETGEVNQGKTGDWNQGTEIRGTGDWKQETGIRGKNQGKGIRGTGDWMY